MQLFTSVLNFILQSIKYKCATLRKKPHIENNKIVMISANSRILWRFRDYFQLKSHVWRKRDQCHWKFFDDTKFWDAQKNDEKKRQKAARTFCNLFEFLKLAANHAFRRSLTMQRCLIFSFFSFVLSFWHWFAYRAIGCSLRNKFFCKIKL